mmetsp:Transcript_20159/g.56176  ORF Transcript_20159/g.56176 Transcript_20159/m.56176 type:complete len:80 (+) Transcript_20159:210-449(+)
MEYCRPFKDRYDKCFDVWWRRGFLQGQISNSCDDIFEDYKACVLESMAARGLKAFGSGAVELPPELRGAGGAAGGPRAR